MNAIQSKLESNKLFSNQLLLFLTCVLAFLESQRFFFSNSVGYFCLIALLFAFLSPNKEIKHSLIILSLFLYEDLVIMASNATPQFIRNILIIFLFFYFLKYLTSIKLKLNRAIIFLIFLSIISINTLLYINALNPVDFNTFRYNAFLIIILFLIICTNTNFNLSINLNYLIYPIIFYLIGETINFFFYQDIWKHELKEYLNYSSLKSMILMPFIYFLIYKKNFIYILFLFISTNIVIAGYGSRYIFLSLYLFVFLYVFFYLKYNLFLKLFLTFILFFSLFLAAQNLEGSFKSTALLKSIFEMPSKDFNLSNLFYEIERVRFMEHKLILSQSIYDILFGKGLGSGLYDSNSYLSFVRFDQTAYSEKEIITKVFYNFHDPWTDIGIRIGLIPFFIIMLKFLFNSYFYLKKSDEKNVFIISCVFVLIINAWFQVIGLIVIFLFYKSLTNNRLGKKEFNSF
jgi:hypothetical protein